MSTPGRSRIVWVELLDPQGRNPKVRPAVILTATEDIAEEDNPDNPLTVLAITTQIPTPLPPTMVELPWYPEGQGRTQLRERSAAVCDWIVQVEMSQIQRYGGTVPAKQMNAIWRILDQLKPKTGDESE